MAKQYRALPLPEGVQLQVAGGAVKITGKLGDLEFPIVAGLTVRTGDDGVIVEADANVPRAQVGTLRALIRNAIVGVTGGYERYVQVRGTGYRAQKTKEGVQIQCGFSHAVDLAVPPGVTLEVASVPNPDDTKQQMFEVTVRGIDCQAVGEFAARMRAVKPTEPYKGKGMRYRGEYIRKKAGKRAVGAQ